MPVNYVAPSPVVASRSSSRSGGGIDAGAFAAMSNAVGDAYARMAENQMRDRHFAAGLDEQARQFNLSRQESPIAAFQQRAAIAQEQERAANLNWLKDQDATRDDVMREKQMQNAVSAILRDQTLSPLERQNAITKLRTGIDFEKERIQQTQMRAEANMMDQRAKVFQFDAELTREKQRFDAAKLNGQIKYVPDADAMFRVVDELKDEIPELDPANAVGNTPEERAADAARRNEELIKRAEMRCVEQGLATMYAPNEKGVVDMTKGIRVGGGKAGEGGSGSGVRSDTGKPDAFERSQKENDSHIKNAMAATDKWASERATPPTDEEYEKEFKKRMAMFQKAHDEFAAANSPESRRKAAKEAQKVNVAQTDEAIRVVQANDALPPGLRNEQIATLREIKKLQTKYTADTAPQGIRDRLIRLQQKAEQLANIRVGNSPAASSAAAPAAGKPVAGRGDRPARFGESAGEDVERLQEIFQGWLKEQFPHRFK